MLKAFSVSCCHCGTILSCLKEGDLGGQAEHWDGPRNAQSAAAECMGGGQTRAQEAEAIDVVQEGNVAHDEGDAPAEAEGEAGCAAEHSVDAAGASVGRYWDPQP